LECTSRTADDDLRSGRPTLRRRLRHYASAVWAENIKEWRLELTYPADFARSLIDPVVYLLPYLLYGVALVGGRQSANLQKLVGTSDLVSFVTLGYVFIGFMNMALWAMGFSLRKEQMYGTLESVFAAPVPRWVFTMGMSAHSILHQLLMIAVQIIFIVLVFSIRINPLGLLPSLAVVGLMMVALYGIGMVMASTTLIFKQGWLISEALGPLPTRSRSCPSSCRRPRSPCRRPTAFSPPGISSWARRWGSASLTHSCASAFSRLSGWRSASSFSPSSTSTPVAPVP
jgi:hypothetical protein